MSTILGIRFAPLNIPIRRRMQTLLALYYVSEFILLPFVYSLFLIALLFTRFWIVSVAYLIFFYLDSGKQCRGGRRSEWFRSMRIWNFLSDFFPVKLIKTCDLPADRNYIFGLHPHGILCFNTVTNFCSQGTGFNRKYPGLVPYTLALDSQFKMPIHRDIFMALGGCSANKESLEYLLNQPGTGKALCLLVGGALEALDAIPKRMTLTLKARKGFLKIAMRHGATLVPVLQFGENECYHQEPEQTGWVRTLQQKFLDVTTFSLPIFRGRGIFQYSFGIVPFRHPLSTVVGRPIEVVQTLEPTSEEIDELHAKYCESLEDLYEEFNPIYGDPDVKLIIK